MLDLFKNKKKTDQPKVLVVDDEPDLVSTVKCRLEWFHCQVLTAANGREGLEVAASERPDIILLDTNMPVMDGHQMLERIKSDPGLKDIPVIMVTALCETSDVAKASSYGIEDYVTKPFDYTVLMRKISDILER